MRVAVAIALLALLDVLLTGFRAAAGRDGRINKVPLYGSALTRAAGAAVVVVAVNAAIVAALVASAAAPATTWQAVVAAGARAVGVFRFVALFAVWGITAWFSRAPEVRILPTLLVLGPLTLVRPLIIVAGLLHAVWPSGDWRVWTVGILAGASMLGIEALLGVPYRQRWRTLV